VLPAGSTLLTDPETLIVNVTHAPTEQEVESELAEAEAEAGIEHEAPQAEAEGAGEGDAADEAAAEESADSE
jgi:large subunit ribosomal protein L25